MRRILSQRTRTARQRLGTRKAKKVTQPTKRLQTSGFTGTPSQRVKLIFKAKPWQGIHGTTDFRKPTIHETKKLRALHKISRRKKVISAPEYRLLVPKSFKEKRIAKLLQRPTLEQALAALEIAERVPETERIYEKDRLTVSEFRRIIKYCRKRRITFNDLKRVFYEQGTGLKFNVDIINAKYPEPGKALRFDLAESDFVLDKKKGKLIFTLIGEKRNSNERKN
ncbi:MAG: hypothetical protein ABH986_05175 [archaeon]